MPLIIKCICVSGQRTHNKLYGITFYIVLPSKVNTKFNKKLSSKMTKTAYRVGICGFLAPCYLSESPEVPILLQFWKIAIFPVKMPKEIVLAHILGNAA
jgi:hypothetical protein